MTEILIAIDNTGQKHITTKGNGSKYCRDNRINLDWSDVNSATGIVMSGGIYFKCLECGTSGVITNSEFTQDLKHKSGVTAYAPLGIEFLNCENHEGIDEDINEGIDKNE